MKKSIILGGSILCLFILCSLSYQPIIAEEPIIETQIEDIPIKSDNCGCDEVFIRWHPILCLLLTPIWLFIAFITEIITPMMNPPLLYFKLERIGTELGCFWG